MESVDWRSYEANHAALANGTATRDSLSPEQRANEDRGDAVMNDVRANAANYRSQVEHQKDVQQQMELDRRDAGRMRQDASFDGRMASAGLAVAHGLEGTAHALAESSNPWARAAGETFLAMNRATTSTMETVNEGREAVAHASDAIGGMSSGSDGAEGDGAGPGSSTLSDLRRAAVAGGNAVNSAHDLISHAISDGARLDSRIDQDRAGSGTATPAASPSGASPSTFDQLAGSVRAGYQAGEALNAARSGNYGQAFSRSSDAVASSIGVVSSRGGTFAASTVKAVREFNDTLMSDNVGDAAQHLYKGVGSVLKAFGKSHEAGVMSAAGNVIGDVNEYQRFVEMGAQGDGLNGVSATLDANVATNDRNLGNAVAIYQRIYGSHPPGPAP